MSRAGGVSTMSELGESNRLDPAEPIGDWRESVFVFVMFGAMLFGLRLWRRSLTGSPLQRRCRRVSGLVMLIASFVRPDPQRTPA